MAIPGMRADEAQLYVLWLKGKDPGDRRGFDKWCRDSGIIGPNKRRALQYREGLSFSTDYRSIIEPKVDPEDIRFVDLGQTRAGYIR
jgi:hypothetical protein